MRRIELLRRLQAVPPFAHARAEWEQAVSPAEAAATLLELADRLDGLAETSVLDLGCGTGRLAIGAALLGARPVRGVDIDDEAIAVARTAAAAAKVEVEFQRREVASSAEPAQLVVMNPPFGAQRRHADRPFWESAFRLARRSIYAFASKESRSFIARQAVAHGAHVLDVVPVPWLLERVFPHHTRDRVPLAVDLWALRTASEP